MVSNSHKKSIAVLPFANMSASGEDEFFCDGMTEEIINALAQIEGLKVTSRTSSFFFKGKQVAVKEIGTALNVSTLLEGSVRMAGDAMRITAQLIDVKEDDHFWSVTWDRKRENIFAVQDEISLLIADKLREHLGHLEFRDHLIDQQTENLSAYEAYLRGRFHFNQWNPTEVATSIRYFQEAITLDPTHTDSHLGLADAYGFMATTGFLPREESWLRVASSIEKAQSIDRGHAGVNYQLANLTFFTACDFGTAGSYILKSLEQKPTYPEARQFVSFLYILRGEMDKAYEHLQFALALDPLNQETIFYKGFYLYRSNDYSGAIRIFDDLLDQNPENVPALICGCYALLMNNEPEKVLNLVAEMPEDLIIGDEKLGLNCIAYLLTGDLEKSEATLKILEEQVEGNTSFQAHAYLYMVYAVMGKNDQAFALLDRALGQRSSILLLMVTDPLSAGLRADPRYLAIHKKLYPAIGQIAEKKKTRYLEDAVAQKYFEKLTFFVEQEQPFLNPTLSLRSLAQQIDIHPNQLSWVLNEHEGKNFNEFINQYRVAHCKKLLIDPANSHISIIGLAFESGFNSKTVFNTFFKKEVGMTPSEYMKRHS